MKFSVDRMKEMGLMLVVVLCFVVGSVAAGSGAGGGLNGTVALDANGAELYVLMEVYRPERGPPFTVEQCVQFVDNAKGGPPPPRSNPWHFIQQYRTSFPPEDFVPPGAQEWCECLVNDPSGISKGEVRFGDLPDESPIREDFEAAFDRCRAQVLDGSDFSTVDICVGMLYLFGEELRYKYATFCGRMCRPLTLDEFERASDYVYYNGGLVDMTFQCERECAREYMPGYCAKYHVNYGPWLYFRGYRFRTNLRQVISNGEIVGRQSVKDFSFLSRRGIARGIGVTLGTVLGNKNELCNYARAFEALRICCSLEEDGTSVFDCDRNFSLEPHNLYYDCMGYNKISCGFPCRAVNCKYLLEIIPEEPQTIWRNKSTGRNAIMFDDDVVKAKICGSAGGCCGQLVQLEIVANCMDPEDREYVGKTTVPINRPTPGKVEDPCFGLCSEEENCVVTKNGKAFCVECAAFLKPKRNGELSECCEYDPVAKDCVTVLMSTAPGICRRDEAIVIMSDDGVRTAVEFKRDHGYACMNPRDFRRNGVGCRIRTNEQGDTICN